MGTYQDKSNAYNCKRCPRGRYQPLAGRHSCISAAVPTPFPTGYPTEYPTPTSEGTPAPTPANLGKMSSAVCLENPWLEQCKGKTDKEKIALLRTQLMISDVKAPNATIAKKWRDRLIKGSVLDVANPALIVADAGGEEVAPPPPPSAAVVAETATNNAAASNCDPAKTCNVCVACCKSYLSGGGTCDNCVKSECPTPAAIKDDVNESPAVDDDEIKVTVPKPRSCATDRANGNCPLMQNFACVFKTSNFQRAKQAKRFSVIASQSALRDDEYYRDVKFAGDKYCMVKQGVNLCDHLGHPTHPTPPPTTSPTLPPTSHADFLKAIDAKAVAQAIREARARHNADHGDDHHHVKITAAEKFREFQQAHTRRKVGCRGRVGGKWADVAC